MTTPTPEVVEAVAKAEDPPPVWVLNWHVVDMVYGYAVAVFRYRDWAVKWMDDMNHIERRWRLEKRTTTPSAIAEYLKQTGAGK